MPFLASAPNGDVYLSWIDPVPRGRHALRFSRWTGQGWSIPETIAEGQNWFVNWVDFPALEILADGSLLAHWLTRAEAGGKYGYGIRIARRAAAPGSPWNETASLNLGDKEDYAGFLSFAGSSAAYLAPPANRPAAKAHGHGDAESHTKTLRFLQLRPDGSPATDVEIDPDVCTCCPTATIKTSDGFLVAYRDHSASEIRDIAILRFANGSWSKPKTLHNDNWHINACPTEGPSIAASGAAMFIAWTTRAGGASKLNLSVSHNEGRTFAAPFRADDGNPAGRPTLAAIDKTQSLLVWLERTDDGAEVRLRRVFASGGKGPSMTIAKAPLSRDTGIPKVAIHKNQVIVAWRDGGVHAAWLPLVSIAGSMK